VVCEVSAQVHESKHRGCVYSQAKWWCVLTLQRPSCVCPTLQTSAASSWSCTRSGDAGGTHLGTQSERTAATAGAQQQHRVTDSTPADCMTILPKAATPLTCRGYVPPLATPPTPNNPQQPPSPNFPNALYQPRYLRVGGRCGR
jgi:hypothetical protein